MRSVPAWYGEVVQVLQVAAACRSRCDECLGHIDFTVASTKRNVVHMLDLGVYGVSALSRCPCRVNCAGQQGCARTALAARPNPCKRRWIERIPPQLDHQLCVTQPGYSNRSSSFHLSRLLPSYAEAQASAPPQLSDAPSQLHMPETCAYTRLAAPSLQGAPSQARTCPLPSPVQFLSFP